jgi:hypothetical protein
MNINDLKIKIIKNNEFNNEELIIQKTNSEEIINQKSKNNFIKSLLIHNCEFLNKCNFIKDLLNIVIPLCCIFGLLTLTIYLQSNY